MNEHLMRAIIQHAAFLELSGDDVVDPDAAVRELEGLAATLKRLSSSERNAFAEFTNRYADSEQKKGQTEEYVNFVRSFPEGIGLIG
jgi:hypothetical protein